VAAFSLMVVAVADGSSLGCATRMPVDTWRWYLIIRSAALAMPS
jgi:hypothetical protein